MTWAMSKETFVNLRDKGWKKRKQIKYPVSLKENSFTLLANSISVAAAPGTMRLSRHIAWQKSIQKALIWNLAKSSITQISVELQSNHTHKGKSLPAYQKIQIWSILQKLPCRCWLHHQLLFQGHLVYYQYFLVKPQWKQSSHLLHSWQ